MKKLVLGSAIAGSGLVLGGGAFLFLNGYDIANPDVWKLATSLVKSEPMTLISASLDGPDKSLFRGLSFVFAGLSVTAIGLGTASILAIVSSTIGAVRKVSKQKNSSDDQKAFKPKREVKLPDVSRIVEAIKIRFERDKEIDLESDFVEPRINATDKGPTKRVHIKRPLKDDLKDLIAGFKERLGIEVKETAGEEKMFFGGGGAATKQEEFKLLTAWYEDVQSGVVDQSELVSRARKICDDWKEADFSEFASLDPINGAFVSRLVRTWADREEVNDDGAEVSEASSKAVGRHDKEAMREAIRALKKGETFELEGEAEVDLDNDEPGVDADVSDVRDHVPNERVLDLDSDDSDLENYDTIIQEASAPDAEADSKIVEESVDDDVANYDAIIAEASEDSDGEPRDVDTESDDMPDPEESASDRVEEVAEDLDELVEILGEMKSFAFHCQSVKDGEDEWPEQISDEDDREAHVKKLSRQLAEQEMFHGDDFLDYIRKFADDYEELEWASDNPVILEKGFEVLVSQILEPSDWDDDEEDVDDEDDADLASDLRDANKEPEAGVIVMSEPADDSEGKVASDSEDATSDLESDEDETSPSVVEGEEQAPTGGQVSSEAASVEGESHPEPNAIEAGEGAEVSDQVGEGGAQSSPVDLSIPVVEEIEVAESIPFEWGRHCKQAGATDGSIAKLIFSKDGTTFKPMGMAHVVMMWKKADGNIRLNVILKKLPAGAWSCRLGDGIRMENEAGDFVEVSKELLEHPEIADNRTVVHFYGEGVENFDDIRVGEGLVAVARVMTQEEIREFIKK